MKNTLRILNVAVLLCISVTLKTNAQALSNTNLYQKYLEGTGNGYGAAQIIYPLEGSVIQRNGENANIGFSAQVGYGFNDATKYNYHLRLWGLDLITGTQNGIYQFFNNLTLSNVTGEVGTIYSFINVQKGWYLCQLIIQPKNTSQEWIAAHINFGIGDTFLIAGQSNARGFPQVWDANLISYDNSLGSSNLPVASRVLGLFKPKVQGELDRINNTIDESIANYSRFTIKGGGMPFFHSFEKLTLQKPVTAGGIDWFERPIYPNGMASWCWAPLGKRYVNDHQVPVQFFNFAIDNSSIDDWQSTRPQNVSTGALGNTLENHFKTLSDFIAMQGNTLGFKSILWHQGENDVALGTSFNTYKDKLNALINEQQNQFDPWQTTTSPHGRVWNPLTWFISKVSYSRAGSPPVIITNDPQNIKGAQTDVANSTLPSNGSIKRLGIDSDVINEGSRGPTQKLHFTGATHDAVAALWKSLNLVGQTPKLGVQGLGPITVAFNASQNTYTLTPPAGYTNYHWVKNEDSLASPTSVVRNQTNRQLIVNASNLNDREIWTCYVKNPVGKNFLMCQPFIVPNSKDRAFNLSVNNVQGFQPSGGNKTTTVFAENVTWTSTISYPPNSPNGWLSIVQNNSGYPGNTNVEINALSNSGSNRTANIIFTGTNGTNQTITRTLNVSQSGAASATSLTSLTPISVNQDFGTLKINQSVDGNALIINNVTYSQGLGTHANSNIKYNLGGNYNTFSGRVGMDKEINGACGQNKVKFIIKADNTLLYESNLLHWQQDAEVFNVNVSGKNTLELIVEATADNIWCDHADWVDLYLNSTGGGGCTTPSAPTNISASPNPINSGQSTTLNATCGSGASLSWQNLSGTSPNVSPNETTTYYAYCNAGSCQSTAGPITVTVNFTGGACSVLSNNLLMGTWNVLQGFELRARLFEGTYWLTQKVNVNGSQYDEFVVRASEMLQRQDVTLNNSSYAGMVNCFSWQYSAYGGLLPPNSSSVPPFPTPSGYCLTTNDGTNYYTNNVSLCGPSGSSNLVNGNCYKIQSLANNFFATDMGNNEIHFQANNNANSQIWKLEGSGTQFIIKRATQNLRLFNSGGWGETMSMNATGVTWNFNINNTSYRVSHPNGNTWDHRGAGGDTELQIWGSLGDSPTNYRLFNFINIGCPSGARISADQTTQNTEEKEMPYLNIAPNPAHDLVAVNIYLDKASEIEINLISVKGELLKTLNKNGKIGLNSYSMDIKGINPGVYVIKALSEGKIESTKLIVE